MDTYCLKCGYKNTHEIGKKPAKCNKCLGDLQILGPIVKGARIDAKYKPVQIIKLNVQPISDEEMGITESSSVNLRDILSNPDVINKLED